MANLHGFDLAIFRAINVGLHRAWLDPVFAFFSYLGLGGVLAAVCLGFLFSRSTRRMVIPLLLADAVSGWGVADLLKVLIPRARPSNLSFAIVQEPIYHSSFPSGHTTTAFAVATMLVFLLWNTRYRKLAWWSYLVAALIGLSRIYRGVHWPTDVVAGACFGIGTTCLLYFILPAFGLEVT